VDPLSRWCRVLYGLSAREVVKLDRLPHILLKCRLLAFCTIKVVVSYMVIVVVSHNISEALVVYGVT